MFKYEKISLVGRGSFGKVFLYKRLWDGTKVVIKEISIDSLSDDERTTTQNEVKVLSMLKHPNIIEYYDSITEVKTVFIIMEYASGGNLFEYLQSRKGTLINEEDALYLFSQLVLGMQHIHKLKILHRDLKSHNVFLDHSHRVVKIGDFGISKILTSKSAARSVVGTPCYLSPELCQERPYNHKSDIWGLGCILYEILALKRAFEAEALGALVQKIMRGSYEPLPSQYSQQLTQLTYSLLYTDPSQRPSIHQIIAQPVVFRHLFRLYQDMGMIKCKTST